MPELIILAVAIIVAVWLFFSTVRVVNEYDRLVVFRLGRTGNDLVKGPGLVFLIPQVDRPSRVDLREKFIEVPSQTTITKDNAPINIDFLIYWRIQEPLKSVVNVVDFSGALQGIVTTTLRAVIGDSVKDTLFGGGQAVGKYMKINGASFKVVGVTEKRGGMMKPSRPFVRSRLSLNVMYCESRLPAASVAGKIFLSKASRIQARTGAGQCS